MEKERFILSEEMTKEQMLEAILKIAREYGVKAVSEAKKTAEASDGK
ncbi:MAG: hypothetical protein ACUVWO_04475 [Thermodesulfobacteriota bacterium]